MAVSNRLLKIAQRSEPSETDGELLRRYAQDRDEAAFAEVVRRNGPLVLRACRSILGETAAEDAFQATFLVLARQSSRLTRPGSLAGWLHAAAVRIARTARRADIRARRRETTRAAASPAAADDLTWREVREVLDAELAALPEKYRVPLVLCYLQDLSYEEAARRAGCPVGALRGRLERGKEQLRKRLAKYGLALAAPALVLGSPAPVSAALTEATLSMVRAGGSVSAAVAGLAGSWVGLRAALITPVAIALAAVGFVLAGSVRPAAETPANSPPTLRAASSEPIPRADRFGDPLPNGAVMRLGTARLRHGEWVTSVSFSPDGTEIASAGFDNTVRIWDVATGKELRRLQGEFIEPHTVAYVDGGKQIITAEGWFPGGGLKPVRLWNAATGEPNRTLVERGPRSLQGVAISPDGKTLAYGAVDGVVVVPCAEGGRTWTMPGGGGRIIGHLAFSPDGTRLLVCSGGNFVNNTPPTEPFGIRLFDLTNEPPAGQPAEPVWRKEGKFADSGGTYPAAEFSPNGKHILVSYNFKEQPALLDAATGKEILSLTGPNIASHPFLFLPGGKQVFSLTTNDLGVVWDATTGKPVSTWPGEMDVHRRAGVSPDGKTVATAGHRAIGLWEAATGRSRHDRIGALGDVNRLAISPDSRRVLAGCSYSDRESGARIWDLNAARQLASFPRRAASTALAADGKTFAVGYREGLPEIADAATGKVLRTAGGENHFLDSLEFGLGGEILVGTGWTDRVIRLWEAETLKPLPPIEAFPVGGGTRSLAATTDGSKLVTAGQDGVVRIWDLAARKELRQVAIGNRGDWKMAVSADGRFFSVGQAKDRFNLMGAAGTETTEIRIWDLATGKLRWSLAGPEDGTNCLAFTPDGRTVAVGGRDRVVRIYEIATRTCRAEFRGHQGPVTSVAFTPDGRRLLSGGSDTTILVWDLTGLLPDAPSPANAAAAWADLLIADAAKADRAMRYLVAAPDAAVAQCKKHLKAEPETDAKRVRKWIEQLGDPVFADREAAQAELERLGPAAEPSLKDAARTVDSAEVFRRVSELLGKLDRLALSGEPLRQARAVEILERIGSPDARAVLAELAKGAGSARLTQDAAEALRRTGTR